MKRLTLCLILFTLAGCSTMTPKDFAASDKKLDLFDYFNGEATAWGTFEDRFGTIRRQFKVDLRGRIEGEELVLDEDFVYADGELDQRTWRIRRDGQGGVCRSRGGHHWRGPWARRRQCGQLALHHGFEGG